MFMGQNRSSWVAGGAIGAFLVLSGFVWLAGFLYWEVQVSRAVADLRRGPGKYLGDPAYVDPEMVRIGSRTIPRLCREAEDAIKRGEQEQAFALTCGLIDSINAAEHLHFGGISGGTIGRPGSMMPLDHMAALIRGLQHDWVPTRHFPPPWKWWEGHR